MKKALFKTMALVVVFVLAFSLSGFTVFAEDTNSVDGSTPIVENQDPAPTESVEPSEDPEPTESVEPSEDPEPTESVEPEESPAPSESPEPTEEVLTMSSMEMTPMTNVTISYDGNGSDGGTVPSSQSFSGGYNVTVTVASGVPTKTGFTFAGWKYQSYGSWYGPYYAGNTFTTHNSRTLVAQWEEAQEYTVTYDANGADSGSVPTDGTVYDGTVDVTVLDNIDLVKAGYAFGGWSDGAATYQAGDTFAISGNVTLSAVWNALYTVTYDANGADSGSVPADGNTYTEGTDVTVLDNIDLVKAGYAFGGWSDGSTTYQADDIFAMGSENVTLSAVWEQLYTVTYDANGADSGSVPVDGNTYTEGTDVTVLGNSDLVKAGYQFGGWSYNGTTYQADDVFAMGSENVTLTAVWEEPYTVTYDANGADSGSVPSDGNTYYNGDTVTVLGNAGNLEKSGKIFAGWSYNGSTYQSGETLTMGDSNVTLSAVWANAITVTYNGNGATSGTVPDSQQTYNGGTVIVSDNTGNLQKTSYSTEYIFKGWSTSSHPGSSSARYAPGDTITVGSSNITLYAVWESTSLDYDHIDVRIAGTLTIEHQVNGVTESSQTINVTVSNPSASYVVNGTTYNLSTSDFQISGNEFRALNLSFTWPESVTINATLTDEDNNTYSYSHTFTGSELVVAANACPGVGTSSRGLDFDLNAEDITNEITHSVTFETETGGTIGGGTTAIEHTGILEGSDCPTPPETVADEGYEFAGWSMNGSATLYSSTDVDAMTIDDDTVFTAKWNCNDNTVNVYIYLGNDESHPYISSPTAVLEHLSNAQIQGLSAIGNATLANALKSTYSVSFPAWVGATVEASEMYRNGQTYMELIGPHTYQVKIYLKAAEDLTVTYNANGGIDAPTDSNDYLAGETVTVLGPGTMTYTGHTFDEWNTEQNGSGTPYEEGDTFEISADTTLWAQWTAIDTYTIDTTVTNGTIDPVDPTVYEGDDQLITYSASTGYHLDSVTVDGVDVTSTNPSSYEFTNVTANHTIEVVYAADTFTIDTTVTNGTIDPVDPTVNYGGNQLITYSASTGYHLDSVTVDGVDVTSTNPTSYEFTNVQANHEIEVVYAIDTFTITTTVTGGTIDPIDPTVNYGGSQTITYSASTGYHLDSVTVDGVDVTATNPSSYEFTNVTANHEIEVVYAIDTFTIDTTVTNGTIDPVDPTVDYGASQTITYSADTGYHLDSVTVDGVDVTATYPTSYEFTNVTANHEIEVVYAIDTFTIDTTVTNGTIDPVDPTVNYGGSQLITYSASTGYHLESVTVDGVDVTATYPTSYEFTNVTANHEIEVVYAIDTFTIDTTVTNGIIIPVDPTVDYGASQTITYSPYSGHHLVSVTVDGVDVTATYPTSYEFTNVQANHEIEVVYAINTYTIDTTVTNGTIDPVDPTVNYGGSQTISYSADTGYSLVSVTVDGVDVTATYPTSYEFTNVDDNHTIEVVYAATVYNITYDLDGGTNDPSNPSTYTVEDPTITLADPTKDGYTFLGWEPTDSIPAGSTGDKTFTATWSDPIAYDITYVLDGGTNDPSNPSTYTVEDDTITLAAPTKDGYTFLGWEPTDSIPAGSTGDKTFTATWSDPIVYSITYNLDGGTNDPGNPSTYTVEDPTIELAAPTRSGYNFNGWTPTGSIPTGSTGDKTFTASWTSAAPTAFLVRFVDFDGTLLSAQWVHAGNGATAPASPTRDGFTFAGWDVPFSNITGPLTVTATYTPVATPVTPAVVPEVIPEEEVPEAAPSAEPEVTPTPAPEVIEEEEVPEAAPGIAWALLNLILAIAGAIMAVVLIVGYFTRKKQEEEGGQRYNIKRRGVARFLSLIPGIGGIIAFLLTEPWWVANIVFTDMWTWLMIVIFAAQVVIAILARKKREEEDGQTPAQA